MNKQGKYSLGSSANFTGEEIAAAKRNFARSASQYPDEHQRVVRTLQEQGLGSHREVLDWYRRSTMPIPEFNLSTIGLFADSTYAGAHGNGVQREASPHANTGSVADRIYGTAVKPDGA